jgi:hypothetical protein
MWWWLIAHVLSVVQSLTLRVVGLASSFFTVPAAALVFVVDVL